MTDMPELTVDQDKTTEPVHMDGTDPTATRAWPNLAGRSTPAEYLQPLRSTPVFTATVSTTPETEAANIHGDGPHFARTVEGRPDLGTVCGQDGQPWPCAAWQDLTRPPEGAPMPDAPAEQPDAMAAVAAAYDLSVEEMHQLLLKRT